MTVRFILECSKSGLWWHFATHEAAARAAIDFGLSDYSIFKDTRP